VADLLAEHERREQARSKADGGGGNAGSSAAGGGGRRSYIDITPEEIEAVRRAWSLQSGSSLGGTLEKPHIRDHVRELFSASSVGTQNWRSAVSDHFQESPAYAAERRDRVTDYCLKRDGFREYTEERVRFKHIFPLNPNL